METYQHDFIELAHQQDVLRFGEFTLKSGRVSPYFFNTGLFNSGASIRQLGYYYATAIKQAGVDFDVLFGPAYKGITLVTTTAIALAEHYQQDVPFAYNRKEIKDHGEGGNIIGASLQGKVLLLDDVITAGTAFHQAKTLVESQGGQITAVVIALDRQERGQQQQSTIAEIEQNHQIPVISIIKLDDLLDYLQQQGNMETTIDKIHAYRNQYGI